MTYAPGPYNVGRTVGRILGTSAGSAIVVGLLLLAYFVFVVYPKTAAVRLENDSMGYSTFYSGWDKCL